MRKIVYTAGVFDLLHEGHLNIIKESKKLGDILVVGVVSDAGAEAYKRRPMFNQKQRLAQVQSLKDVDLAIIQETTDPLRELSVIRPQIFTHGSDWDRLKQGHETLEANGIQYVSIPYTNGVSTTQLIIKLDLQ